MAADTHGLDILGMMDRRGFGVIGPVWTLLGIVCLCSQPAWGADVIDLHMGYYKDDNQLTVNTPSLNVSKDLSTETALNIKYTYETFEKEAPSNTMDAVTGATSVSGGTGGGYDEVRHEVVGGVSQRIGSSSIALGGFYGDEDDFLSWAYSVALSQEFFQKNLTITLQYGKTADEILKLDPPTTGFPKHKDNATYTVAATQVLSPTAIATAGYALSHVEGYQSLPLRKVLITQSVSGVPVATVYDETHPDLRDRHTVFLRLRQYLLSRTAGDVNLSYYIDDWGVQALAVEPRVEHYLTDSVVIGLRYLFYSQTAADFYREIYTVPEQYMTADVRLRKFDAHQIGATLRLFGDTATDWTVSMGYDRYFQTNNGIQANMFQVGLTIPY
ncbi:MAG: DUF3570 domain-containing protein [Nitrospirota bacterium]